MKRITAFLLALVVLCFLLGCEISDPIGVGYYNGDERGYYEKMEAKYMGHNNVDIYNPTQEQAELYCSLCHYVN